MALVTKSSTLAVPQSQLAVASGSGSGGVIYNQGQQIAFDGICEFLRTKVDKNNPSTYRATLNGSAGTGKTFLTRRILAYATGVMNMDVMGVSPTHKACHVLDRALNKGSFVTVPVCTVASLLYKLKSHGYVGSKNYKSTGTNKIGEYDLLIIDEASMIADDDVETIERELAKANNKAIFVGDSCQIPCPGQGYYKCTQNGRKVLVKKNSCVFDWEDNVFTLYEIMRQKDDNPLINIYDVLRLHISDDVTDLIPRETMFNSKGEGVLMTTDRIEFISHIIDEFQDAHAKGLLDPFRLKIIAYTNKSIKKYNKIVRKALGYTDSTKSVVAASPVGASALAPAPFVVGELLMGYNSIGWPQQTIENGQDYKVISIEHTTSHTINKLGERFTDLVGWLVKIEAVSSTGDHGSQNIHFFPDIRADANYNIFSELVKRAKKVESWGSSTADYKAYKQLKDLLIFTENVYWFGNKIIDDATLSANHPLLLTHVSECITDDDGKRRIAKGYLTNLMKDQYPEVLEYRLEDKKVIGDSETFADRFQVIEKDIDYGYAITAHKSQGSSIHTVLIDETDFDRIRDRWNWREQRIENKTQEKNQLRYVAYTRPSSKAIIYYSAADEEPEIEEEGDWECAEGGDGEVEDDGSD